MVSGVSDIRRTQSKSKFAHHYKWLGFTVDTGQSPNLPRTTEHFVKSFQISWGSRIHNLLVAQPISNHLAADKKVRGMIVASEITEDLKLATSLIEGVKLWQYRLSFQVDHVAIDASSA